MNEPIRRNRRVIRYLQSEALAAHGGIPGLRDMPLLDSALARPINQFHYNAAVDLAQLAAAYGFGLAKNRAFADGNKRIAFIATTLFLLRNGYRLVSETLDEINIMMSLAAGELSEDEFATWLRAHAEPYT
jgi:death-on-curing protein